MSSETVGARGEDGVVAGILAGLAGGPGRGLLAVGPGDDAAVLALPAGQAGGLVLSTDTLVEDRDFRRGTTSGADVGAKVAAQNHADVAAMGARPLALLVSLSVPGDVPVAWVDGLLDGVRAECERAGAVLAGGDVSAASEIVLTGTAVGTMDGRAPVLRSGAQPGDVVALAGRVGPAAAGLALLEAGHRHGFEELLAAQRRPRPPYPAGPAAAAAGATAMIDTSDGLVRDATRVAAASGVLIDLDPGALRGADLTAAASALGLDGGALDWVLGGGEDHALLACFPPGARLPAGFRRVGQVLAGGPGVLLGGEPWHGPAGWTHFSGG